MNREQYDAYLGRFNARDYRGVLEYYAPDFEVRFAGVTLHGPRELLDFYGFLHGYLTETITVLDFLSSERLLFIEAAVRIEGRRDLTAAALAQAGYSRLHPLRAGQVIEMRQFIHYRLSGGRFTEAVCAILDSA